MTKVNLGIWTVLFLISWFSCVQNVPSVQSSSHETSDVLLFSNQKPHEYGAWYCPDNLIGFPAVDIKDWKSVPVVTGRLPTKEETLSGSSLIFVDKEKYPNAKPTDIQLPQLAKFYNKRSKIEEIVIVIQAIDFSEDKIVGFRYLNGGNGSAHLNQVKFLSDKDIKKISDGQFVAINLKIHASKDKIWKVLTDPEFAPILQPIFDKHNKLKQDWYKNSKVNFKYNHEESSTSEFTDLLYGNLYIQLDSEIDDYQYVEKFLILKNKQTKNCDLKIVCGPYFDDYEEQRNVLHTWAQKVKGLSEGNNGLFNPKITK